MHTEVDEYDRPLTLARLAEELRKHGEVISAATLWRWARLGLLPVARVGTTTSTMRSYYESRRPRLEKLGGGRE